MKTAKEILRELGCSYNSAHDGVPYYIVDTDEDHVLNAMLVFAQQILELAAEEATCSKGNSPFSWYEVDKESILNLINKIQ